MLLLLFQFKKVFFLPFLSFVVSTHLRPYLLTTHWKILWIVWKFSRTSWSFFPSFADSRFLYLILVFDVLKTIHLVLFVEYSRE
jgi:hypothetical protein